VQLFASESIAPLIDTCESSVLCKVLALLDVIATELSRRGPEFVK
jgi:hypothetical protein